MTAAHQVDPTQAAAEERIGSLVSRTLLVVALLAAVGVVVPGASWVAGVGVGLVTAIPVLRVVWLIVRWVRIRDMRYAWAGVVLLALIAVGPAFALLS